MASSGSGANLLSDIRITAPDRSVRVANSLDTATTRQGWPPVRRTTRLPGTGRCPSTPAADTTSSAVLTAASTTDQAGGVLRVGLRRYRQGDQNRHQPLARTGHDADFLPAADGRRRRPTPPPASGFA